ncbi:hypothetical protein BT96DRAFT_999175 [Gymnopus androsaceus JB14]|uniref:Uncharacterized protein n=1 Tax=Gymnopus androsaceus JB14 TaxID=1447944 RepID=A0A6A4H6A6_9AGAR|nr:hypothetical protein BT96DRAFT_999175 [Gymnopus androsaceus JB14]
MASETLSPLRLLGQIINDSINIIEERLAEASVSFPSLDDPFNPTSKVESILVEPDIISATSHIVAAAAQLDIRSRLYLTILLQQFLRSSCIRAAIDGSLVEIVREAGAQGIHVNDIAAKNNTDPLKFGEYKKRKRDIKQPGRTLKEMQRNAVKFKQGLSFNCEVGAFLLLAMYLFLMYHC